MTDVQCLLLAARTLIADPECWTQQSYARDETGDAIPEGMPTAVCWCASGALWFVGDRNPNVYTAHDVLARAIGSGVTNFNDSHSHAQVIAAFDCALEIAEAV